MNDPQNLFVFETYGQQLIQSAMHTRNAGATGFHLSAGETGANSNAFLSLIFF